MLTPKNPAKRNNDDDVLVSVVKCVKSTIFPLVNARNVRKLEEFSIISTRKNLKTLW